MKGSDHFKEAIQSHLIGLADKDELFAETLKKPNKNIEGCITYILNTVQKSNCNGFADEEIFGMAVHYYDEDNLDPGKPLSATVMINRSQEPFKGKPVKKENRKPEQKIAAPTLFD